MHRTPKKLHKTPKQKFTLVMAGRHRALVQQHYPMHQHETWEVIYFLEGRIRVVLPDLILHTEPGMIIAIPPGMQHEDLADTAYANYHLEIDMPASCAWPLVSYDDVEYSLMHTCGALTSEFLNRMTDCKIMIDLLLHQLNIQIRRASFTPDLSIHEHLVRRAELLLEKNSASPFRINQLARQVGCSQSALRASFAQIRGYGPLTYLHKVRIRAAVYLLSHSDLTLEEVAARSGYHSASHLSRHVKSGLGKTPGQLRQH